MTEQKWWLLKEEGVDHIDTDAHPVTGDMVYGLNKKDVDSNGVAHFSYRVYVQRAATGQIQELRRYVAGINMPYGRSSVKIQPSGNLVTTLAESFDNVPNIKIGATINVLFGVFPAFDLGTWDEARIQALESNLLEQTGQIAALQQQVAALQAQIGAGGGGLTADEVEWVRGVRAVE